MSTSKKYYNLTVSCSGTIGLTTWKNEAGGSSNGALSFSGSETISSEFTFGTMSDGKCLVTDKTQVTVVSPSPSYKFAGLPYVIVGAGSSSVNTPTLMHDNNINNGVCYLSKSSDGARGSASLGTSVANFTYSEAYTLYTYTHKFIRSHDGKTTSSYTVKYKDSSLSSGSDHYAAPDAAPSGYVFVEWNISPANASVKLEGTKLTIYKSNQTDVTATAVYRKAKCTFKFDANGGSGDFPDKTAESNSSFDFPVAPTRTGYNFKGWKSSADNGSIYLAGQNIQLSAVTDGSTTTFTAQWELKKFSVNIMNDIPAAGRLSLYSGDENVAEESNGVLSATVSYGIYEIRCSGLSDLYTPLGMKIGDGYSSSFVVDSDGDLEFVYEFRKKTTYSVSLEFDPSKGSVGILTPPDETVDGVDKWLENRIEVAISPKTDDGWKFKIANIVNGNIVDSSYTSLTDGKLGFTLGFDTNVKVEFERARYTYKAEVDGPSASGGAIQSVSASVEDESTDSKVEHGQFVKYSATVSSGYEFAGWYDGDKLVSSSNPYNCEMLKDTVLTAKAKVPVSLSVETEDGEKENPPVLYVNGEVCEDSQYSSDIVLGESLSYSLDKGDWFFDSWYSGRTPVSLPMEDKLTPTAATDLVAKFTATELKRTLTVKAINTSDGIPIADPDLIRSSVVPTPPSGASLQGTPPPGTYSFEFKGTQYVRVSAEEVAGDLPFNFFAGSTIEGGSPDVESILSREKDYDFLLNADRMIYACYGELANVTTRFTFAAGSDRTMGEILVDSDNAVPDADGSVTVEAIQQSMIAVTVRAKNGYEFVGWYPNNLGNGDVLVDSAEAKIPVTTQRTLYAKFKKNPHAVYEWEGSAENKMMEWRSKVYAAPVPFNPSAARVDARGYGVALEVGMYSSPDGNPTRKAEIVVKNQDARRLPTLRPERYMQVCVKNDAEVDAVIVGTSMKGLAV